MVKEWRDAEVTPYAVRVGEVGRKSTPAGDLGGFSTIRYSISPKCQ